MLNKHVEEMTPPHPPKKKSSCQIARSKDGYFRGNFLLSSITLGDKTHLQDSVGFSAIEIQQKAPKEEVSAVQGYLSLRGNPSLNSSSCNSELRCPLKLGGLEPRQAGPCCLSLSEISPLALKSPCI